MKNRLNLHFKQNTLTELEQLAQESDIKDSKVYLCKRLIKSYASKIREDQPHAANPIKNKLLHKNYDLKTIIYPIWMTDEELTNLKKLVEYHYYINPQTGKNQYSIFLACLIRHQWEKKFNEKTIEENPVIRSINPNLLDPSKYPRHDGENWGGD